MVSRLKPCVSEWMRVTHTHTHTHKCTGSRQQQKNYDCVIKEEMCSRMLRSTHENQSQSSHVSISFNVVVFLGYAPEPKHMH